MARRRTMKILEDMETVVINCKDMQNTIDTARNTFPADKSFTTILDNLQDKLDLKAQILEGALHELTGI